MPDKIEFRTVVTSKDESAAEKTATSELKHLGKVDAEAREARPSEELLLSSPEEWLSKLEEHLSKVNLASDVHRAYWERWTGSFGDASELTEEEQEEALRRTDLVAAMRKRGGPTTDDDFEEVMSAADFLSKTLKKPRDQNTNIQHLTQTTLGMTHGASRLNGKGMIP